MHSVAGTITGAVDTPFGAITLVVINDDAPVVIGAAFGNPKSLMAKIDRKYRGVETKVGKVPTQISTLISQWADGNFLALAEIPIHHIGTPFQLECWSAMRAIKPGTTLSYRELAQKTSNPRAIRATATCCATNLIAPIVPCHRIIKSDQTLGNYGFGVSLKKRLLIHEGFLA